MRVLQWGYFRFAMEIDDSIDYSDMIRDVLCGVIRAKGSIPFSYTMFRRSSGVRPHSPASIIEESTSSGKCWAMPALIALRARRSMLACTTFILLKTIESATLLRNVVRFRHSGPSIPSGGHWTNVKVIPIWCRPGPLWTLAIALAP